MKNFVISLIDAHERRSHIESEFIEKNIDFTFFDAINKSQIDECSQRLGLKLANADLTGGEKACLLSHVSLWKMAIDLNLDYIAIYEDDILLGAEIQDFLKSSNWISSGIDVVKLEVFSLSALMSFKRIPVNNSRHLRRLKGIHLGAAGYILSQKSAKFLLEYMQNLEKVIAIDHILFEDILENSHLTVYQLCPGLCIQSDRLDTQDSGRKIVSQLELERRERLDTIQQNKVKRNLMFKIKREYQRFIGKLGLMFGCISFK